MRYGKTHPDKETTDKITELLSANQNSYTEKNDTSKKNKQLYISE